MVRSYSPPISSHSHSLMNEQIHETKLFRLSGSPAGSEHRALIPPVFTSFSPGGDFYWCGLLRLRGTTESEWWRSTANLRHGGTDGPTNRLATKDRPAKPLWCNSPILDRPPGFRMCRNFTKLSQSNIWRKRCPSDTFDWPALDWRLFLPYWSVSLFLQALIF